MSKINLSKKLPPQIFSSVKVRIFDEYSVSSEILVDKKKKENSHQMFKCLKIV